MPFELEGRIPQSRIAVDRFGLNDFTVTSGDRYANHLTFDEALAAVACELCRGMSGFLRTEQQHQDFRKHIEKGLSDAI